MEYLMSQQLRDAIDEEYYIKLEDLIFEYTRVKAMDILTHILDNYAIVNNQVINANMLAFDKAPDFALLINVYFKNKKVANSSPWTEVNTSPLQIWC